MGNAVTITSGGGAGGSGLKADINATSFVARFKNGRSGSSQSGDARYATQVVLNSGEAPSYGFVGIPINEFGDEQAPAVALKTTGVPGRIPPNTRVVFDFVNGNKSKPVMSGTLVQYVHAIGDDSAMALVFDDKWLLSKITVFGRAVFDPRTNKYYFDAASDLCFNELGFPNCIDTSYGPRFAPSHRFGYGAADFNEPAPGSATTRARSWTVADILEYLRAMYYTSGDRPPMGVDYGKQTVPHWINWPSGLSHILGDTRSCMDFNLNNLSLLRALSLTLRRGGAYDLVCEVNGFNSTLKVVNMNPASSGNGGLHLPSYDSSLGIAGLINGPTVIHSGYVNESIINYFHDVCICGDPVAVERFVSTAAVAPFITGMPTEALGGLEPAWDRGTVDGVPIPIGTPAAAESDEWLFLKYIQTDATGVGTNSAAAFDAACKLWPDVFCRYRVPNGYDVWKDTKCTVANGSPHARMRPALLTGDNESSTNPAQWTPKPITVEYNNTNGTGAQWAVADRYDNLTLTPDGRSFRLEVLRAKQQTWFNTEAGNKFTANIDGLKMQPNHIRLSIVMESDHRLTGVAKGDPNGSGLRVGGDTYTYLAVSNPLNYVEWLRHKSFPAGGVVSMGGKMTETEGTFEDRAVEGEELFTDRGERLPRHAVVRLKDVKRIEYTGQVIIACLNPALKPGQPVSIEGANTIQTFSVIKTVTFDASTQTTTVDLSNADSQQFYDIPVPGTAKSPPLAGAMNDYPKSETPKTGRENPQSEKEKTGKAADYGDTSATTGGKSSVDHNKRRNDFVHGPDETQDTERGIGREGARGGEGAAGAGGRNTGNRMGKDGEYKSGIIQGSDLERRDAATAALGNPESGIFTADQARARGDEKIAKFYGRGSADEMQSTGAAGRSIRNADGTITDVAEQDITSVRGDQRPERNLQRRKM